MMKNIGSGAMTGLYISLQQCLKIKAGFPSSGKDEFQKTKLYTPTYNLHM